jgi:hypothetical protein
MAKERPMSVVSFFDISLETANKFYSWGWKASIIGALITLVGISLLMWSTKVRDRDFEDSISQLSTDAAKANELAAQAEKRATEAKLELEELKAPRILSEEQKETFIKSLEGAPRGLFVLMFKSGDDESRLFAMQIRDLLTAAGYINKDPNNNLGWFQNDEPREGVAIRVGSEDTQPPYAGAFQRAFKSIGIEPLIMLGAFEDSVVDVKIGKKP